MSITIADARKLKHRLQSVSDSPDVDIDHFLCHVLQKPTSYLRTWPDKTLSEEESSLFNAFVERRVSGEPVAYIVGHRAFWDFDLLVSPDTLIPRADTEVLVETVLSLLADSITDELQVVDLGTGTGAIALTLAKECPRWHVFGCDLMQGAVELANKNKARLAVPNVTFVQSSWFDALSGTYDLVVSNPPYIDPLDPHLASGDVRFEPLSALVAVDSGMADIKHIAKEARTRLNSKGWLAFEHGYDQGAQCRSLLIELGYLNVDTVQDYGGNDRVTVGQWGS